MVLEQFTVSLGIVFLGNLFFLLFATLSFFGYLSLNKFLLIKNSDNSFLLIKFSLILMCFIIIGGIINFFFPISNTLVAVIYLSGFIIFIFKYKKKENIIELKWIFFIYIFITLYLYNSGSNNDFGYHSHHISLYKNYSLFNFNQNIEDIRVKYNSVFLLLNSITFHSDIFISIKFLSAFIFALFIFDIKKLIEYNKNPNILRSLSLFALICFFLTLSKFKNIGTDYSAHLIYFSLILFYVSNNMLNRKFFESKEFFFICSSIISLLVVLKISMVLCSLIFLHYFFTIHKSNQFLKVFSFKLLLPFILVFIWIFQNFTLSKCIIYPLSQLCLLDEPLLRSVIFEHNMINLFAKSVKIDYWATPIETLREMNSIFYWFSFWVNDHFWKISEKFVPSIILFFILTYKLFSKSRAKLHMIENQNIFFLLIFLSLIIWFIQTPAMRFGFSYLVINLFNLFILILNSLNIGFRDNLKENVFSRIFNFAIILMIFYQFIRISSF